MEYCAFLPCPMELQYQNRQVFSLEVRSSFKPHGSTGIELCCFNVLLVNQVGKKIEVGALSYFRRYAEML